MDASPLTRVDQLAAQLLAAGLSEAEEAELDGLLIDEVAHHRFLALLETEGLLRAIANSPDVSEAIVEAIRQQRGLSVQRSVMRQISSLPMPAWRLRAEQRGKDQMPARLSPSQNKLRLRLWAISATLLALAFAVAWAIVGRQKADAEAAALVPVYTIVEGEATVLDGAGQIAAANTGVLLPGQTLRCSDEEAVARLKYPDGTELRIAGIVEVRVERSKSGGKLLHLVEGLVTAEVAPQPPGRPMLVVTAQATFRILGTRFVLSASAGEGTRLDLDRGQVEILSGEGPAVAVEAGSTAVISPDSAAVEVKPQPVVVSKPARELPMTGINCARFAQDGPTVIGTMGRRAFYWDPDDRFEAVSLKDDDNQLVANGLAGNLALCEDHRARRRVLWDFRQRCAVAASNHFGGTVLAFSPQGDWIALFGLKGKANVKVITIHHLSDGREVDVPDLTKGPSAAASPDGRWLAVGRRNVELVSAETGELHTSLKGGGRSYASLAFSADCRRIVASRAGAVDVWDVGEKLIRTLPQEAVWARAVAISADHRLVAATFGERVWLWELASGGQLAVFDQGESVRSLDFSPDARQLLSLGASGIKIWKLDEPWIAGVSEADLP